MEQKLDTVVMVMGGLGLMEIQDDTHQEPEINLFGPSVLNSNTFSQYSIFNNMLPFSLFRISQSFGEGCETFRLVLVVYRA